LNSQINSMLIQSFVENTINSTIKIGMSIFKGKTDIDFYCDLSDV